MEQELACSPEPIPSSLLFLLQEQNWNITPFGAKLPEEQKLACNPSRLSQHWTFLNHYYTFFRTIFFAHFFPPGPQLFLLQERNWIITSLPEEQKLACSLASYHSSGACLITTLLLQTIFLAHFFLVHYSLERNWIITSLPEEQKLACSLAASYHSTGAYFITTFFWPIFFCLFFSGPLHLLLLEQHCLRSKSWLAPWPAITALERKELGAHRRSTIHSLVYTLKSLLSTLHSLVYTLYILYTLYTLRSAGPSILRVDLGTKQTCEFQPCTLKVERL